MRERSDHTPDTGAGATPRAEVAYAPSVAARLDLAYATIEDVRARMNRRNPDDESDRDSLIGREGTLRALLWGLGRSPDRPIRNAPGRSNLIGHFVRTNVPLVVEKDSIPPSTEYEISDEHGAAEYAIYHPRETGIVQGYAAGVEHALLWLLGDTDRVPL